MHTEYQALGFVVAVAIGLVAVIVLVELVTRLDGVRGWIRGLCRKG